MSLPVQRSLGPARWCHSIKTHSFSGGGSLARLLLAMSIGTAVAALLLCGAFGANRVSAQAYAGNGEDPGRYRLLESYLCDVQRPARVYNYSWLGGLSGLLVIQGALALSTDGQEESDRAARTGYIVGAAMTAVGLGLVGFTSRPESNSCDVLRALPADSPEARTARLLEGERRLSRAARVARRQTSWWVHGLGVLLGVGVGLGLGFGYSDNALRASAQGVGTFAMTELRIWTRPTRAIEYGQRYEQLYH